MQKMVIFIKANTYNTANLSKLGPRVVAHIILSHPNGCGVPCLGLGVMSHKCLFAGPWGLIVTHLQCDQSCSISNNGADYMEHMVLWYDHSVVCFEHHSNHHHH
jgi:hypothetical protein